MRLITINVDLTDGTLALDDPLQGQALDPNEDVEWLFAGIPNNYYPAIKFVVSSDPEESPAGPFAHLRQTPTQVFGSGRSATSQRGYSATVIPAGEVPGANSLEVASALITHSEDVESSTPTIVVRPDPDSPGELIVSPDEFSIVSGCTVTWLFEGFGEPHWSPHILFLTGPRGAEGWPFGPFTSLTTGDKTVIAGGNTHVTGYYTYEAAIRDSEAGTILRAARVDPGLGNDGDPAGGSG